MVHLKDPSYLGPGRRYRRRRSRREGWRHLLGCDPLTNKRARARRRDAGVEPPVARTTLGFQGSRSPDHGGALIVKMCDPVSEVRWNLKPAPAGVHRFFRH